MDEDKYETWYETNEEMLLREFAEQQETEFNDFCMERYASWDADLSDYLYECWRDDQIDKQQSKTTEDLK